MIAGKLSDETTTSLPKNSKVSIDIPGGDKWSFKTEYTPEVEFVPRLDHHIIGIRYFEENSLLIDLETGQIGLQLNN